MNSISGLILEAIAQVFGVTERPYVERLTDRMMMFRLYDLFCTTSVFELKVPTT